MDLDLEKVAISKEIDKRLSGSTASYFAINIISEHSEVVEYITNSHSAVNVRVDAMQQLGTLPKYFGIIREEIKDRPDVELMLISHNLGWPLIEISHVKMGKIQSFGNEAAIFASDNEVVHGQAFYDEDVL